MKTKELKIKEAEERNELWNRFSTGVQLAHLDNRPGKSTKQRRKITERKP